MLKRREHVRGGQILYLVFLEEVSKQLHRVLRRRFLRRRPLARVLEAAAEAKALPVEIAKSAALLVRIANDHLSDRPGIARISAKFWSDAPALLDALADAPALPKKVRRPKPAPSE
jgi:hypothetical protein